MLKRSLLCRPIFTVFLMHGLFGLGCSDKAPAYQTEALGRRTLKHTVVASGEVNARTRVNVGSQVSGIVAEVCVDFGSKVKRGDRLLTLDRRLLSAAAERTEASVAARRAEVLGAELALKQAERAHQRQQKLADGGLAAPVELEATELKRDTALAQQRAANAQLAQARADAHQAQTNLALTQLTSPIDGLVIDRQVQVGQTVAAQFQVQTLFTVASDMTDLHVLTSIDEADIGSIAVGLKASLRVDAYPGRVFVGEVAQVRQAPTTVAGGAPGAASSAVVTYLAVIATKNTDGALRQGMTAQMTIEVETHQNVLAAPLRALRFEPATASSSVHIGELDTEEDLSQGRLYTLDKGVPTPHQVTLGIRDNRYVEVISGLDENAEILVGLVSKKVRS